ncbi:hybrid sensor histidine kinase/response regulator [Hydrogenimonas cancrithermarum]|uniref:histidine kinase n=1 Tax=Hydrogenimonas cancrithermarum TaxID=2993563 RepID=A0ABM8FMK0_9BACT|nr:chemotaxis protein CheW [Hydrogenimonas cancrithermarum]BDY13597.1 chemotaxis protein A [Hydrogenimonas cancrithermarum]
MDEFQEILEDFLVEAFEMIEQLDNDLIELENSPEDLDLLNRIFRVAHTIKGSSSFLNFDVLTHLTHHMEDVLNKARRGELLITPEVMDVVLESTDKMKGLLEHIKETGSDEGALDVGPTVARLEAALKGEPIEEMAAAETKSEPEPEPAAEEKELSEMSDEEIDAEIERLLQERQEEDRKRREEKKKAEAAAETPGESGEKDLSEMSEAEIEAEIERLLKERQEEDRRKREAKKAKKESVEAKEAKPAEREAPAKASAPRPVEPKQKPEAKTAVPKERKATVEQTIRVDVKRLDDLMNLIGELVLGKNRLLKIYDDVEERYEGEQFLEELNQVVSSISLVTTDLQIAVMKTRMLPIGKVFNKFPRMVRDLSRELHKEIELVISGEETELDKSIVEEIGDPLVHIIRNSCDHGIEPPEERVAKGKPPKGTVQLKAYNEGNHIIIEIVDDGKGLDAEMLKMKAVEKGLISEKEADQMSDKEAFMLIFRPGFSTAAKVTNVSGRGVGMDVVKSNIEKLNGIIEIDSEKGKGTTLKLKIPLTLAIIQSLLVSVQDEYYAVPLASVLETVRITPDEIQTVEGRSVLRLRDEVLSLVHLADIFDVERVFSMGEHAYVVIIGLAESKIGLIVDSLVGQEEIVIKSLGEYLKGIEGIAGATIRGDGRVTLIVDVGVLMDMAKHVKSSIKNLESQVLVKEKNSPSDYNILIVDDSKTDRTIMRKALEPLGVTIAEATNGVEALNMMKDGSKMFDAALVDIEMPRMDGYTLASEIRKFNKFKNIPLIAVTSRTSRSDRLRGVEVGMTEYITKPYTPDYLMNVVARNINLNVEQVS